MTWDEQRPRIGSDGVSNGSGAGTDSLGYRSVRGYSARWDELHDLDDIPLERKYVLIVEFHQGSRFSSGEQLGHVFCEHVSVPRWFASIEASDVAFQILLESVPVLAES